MKTSWPWLFGLAATLLLGAPAWADAAPHFKLKGTVYDADGSPVADAVVEQHILALGLSNVPRPAFDPAGPEPEPQVSSGPDGRFEIPLPQGAAVVLVRKAGLAPAWKQFWNVQADAEESFVLSPPTSLGGIAVDVDDQPVADAEVFANLAVLEIDLGGGRRSFNYLSGPPARHLFSTRTGSTTGDVTVLATPGGVLNLVTRSRDDRQPLAGVSIHAGGRDYRGNVTTDELGSARLRLPPGPYQVMGMKGNARSIEYHTSVEANQTNHIEIVLEPPPTITGVVLDPDGRAVPDVEVMLSGGYFGPDATRATTDSEGRYSLTWDPRRFASGIDRTVCLIVRNASRMDADDNPVAGAHVHLHGEGQPNLTVQTDHEGRFARWATGVESLPWLILSDAEGKVLADGFGIDELDAKLDLLKE